MGRDQRDSQSRCLRPPRDASVAARGGGWRQVSCHAHMAASQPPLCGQNHPCNHGGCLCLLFRGPALDLRALPLRGVLLRPGSDVLGLCVLR